MTKKVTFLLLALYLCAVSAAWAVDSIQVTGKFFNNARSRTVLCAQVLPAEANVSVFFTGVTPHGIVATAGPRATDIFGRVCVNVDWFPGVYTVTAQVVGSQAMSPPVAVAVYSIVPNWEGAVAGGELHLTHFGVPPNVQTTLDERIATFAIWQGIYPARWFGLLYYDNDNPQGPVCVMAKSYRNAIPYGPYGGYLLRGVGTFQQGANPPRYVQWSVYVDDAPPEWFIVFEVRDFAGNLLYSTYNEDYRIFNGGSIVDL